MDIEERLEKLAEFAPQYKAIAIDAAREIRRLRERHAEIIENFYGHGFEVLGWHLNGDTAPLDGWFDENDWIESEDHPCPK